MAAKSNNLALKLEEQAVTKVLVDARKIFHGGIGVYIQNLIEGFAQSPEVELGLIVRSKEVERIQTKFPVVGSYQLYLSDCGFYSMAECFSLLKNIPQEEYDVFHSPQMTLPFGLKIPAIVTIHDLIQITHPEKFYYPAAARFLLGNSVVRADKVLTVSQSSAGEIKKYFAKFGVNKKLAVIPNALGDNFKKQRKASDYLKSRFDLSGNYLIAVASNLKPHKGLVDLINSFNDIQSGNYNDRAPADLKLIIVGIGAEEIPNNEKLFKLVSDTEKIRVLGKVSDEDLANLYAGARALVVPSLVEGFCLQAIQAKAQGLPVIARPIAAVKELLDQSDVVAEDLKQSSLRKAIVSFFDQERKKVSEQEITDYQQRFDIENVCKKVLDVYRSV